MPGIYFPGARPPPLPDLAKVVVTVDTWTLFGGAAFFGFLISRFERVWPLAIMDVLS
jgi:hypothetical protein